MKPVLGGTGFAAGDKFCGLQMPYPQQPALFTFFEDALLVDSHFAAVFYL